MSNFQNNPNFSGEASVKRYVHQPLTVEHYGLHAKIQENGRVLISSVPEKDTDGKLIWDEVEIPASLVFKLATLLKATRSVKFVNVQQATPEDIANSEG